MCKHKQSIARAKPEALKGRSDQPLATTSAAGRVDLRIVNLNGSPFNVSSETTTVRGNSAHAENDPQLDEGGCIDLCRVQTGETGREMFTAKVVVLRALVERALVICETGMSADSKPAASATRPRQRRRPRRSHAHVRDEVEEAKKKAQTAAAGKRMAAAKKKAAKAQRQIEPETAEAAARTQYR
eukprot:m.148733 g.148733  ORF g.148733 m.148733 type:complete len:185 (+) comp9722_c0_seq3:575-1129(+)